MRHVVWVSQENRQHILGHLNLLGLTEPVMPWATDGPGEGEVGGSLEMTGSHWADAAHRQGATVVIAHFPTPNAEAPVLIATGRADAVEMFDQLTYEHLEYYRYLNDGYRLPLVAGTDKMSSGTPVGLYRTYAQLGPDEPFSFAAWTAAIRDGRTFITSGPILHFLVDGRPIGSTLAVRPGRQVEVECEATSIFPIYALQLVERGRVIDEITASGGARHLRLKSKVTIGGPTWLAARCGGPGYTAVRHYDERRRGVMAHTSPIYVATGHDYDLRDKSTSEYMLSMVAAGREYVRTASAQFPPGTVAHHHGRSDHLAYLEEPFDEAEQRIRERLAPTNVTRQRRRGVR